MGVEVKNRRKKDNLDLEKIKRLYVEENKSTYEIAELFNVSASTINDRLKKMGVKIKDRRLRDDISDEDIIKLKKEGKTQKQMSEILGCSHGYINKRLKKLSLN